MNAKFITMPSGWRLNVNNIVSYLPIKDATKPSVRIYLIQDLAGTVEDMTAEQLDNLLQPSSPIVSPVVDLDRLKAGSACQFTYEGKQRHGVIEYISSAEGKPYVSIISDGETIQGDI